MSTKKKLTVIVKQKQSVNTSDFRSVHEVPRVWFQRGGSTVGVAFVRVEIRRDDG